MKIETPYEVGDVVWVLHKPGAGGLYEPMRGVLKQITVQIYGKNEAEASYAVEEKIYDWFREVFPSLEAAQLACQKKNEDLIAALKKLKLDNYRDRLKQNKASIERLQKDNEEIKEKLKKLEEEKCSC